MTKQKPADVASAIVDLLSPLESEDRRRVVQAVMMLLGETPTAPDQQKQQQMKPDADLSGVHARAAKWMDQHQVTLDELHQVFHIASDGVEVIADIPGKNSSEKVRNTYILAALANFIGAGEPNLEDKSGRQKCVSAGCYDSTNHTKYVSAFGSELTVPRPRVGA